jgi:quinolinate synthase
LSLTSLQNEILDLKKTHGITLLAHFYQPLAIQQVADYIGDSLGLAEIARDKITTPNIVFAGVKFMAETASILNQSKRVYSPDPHAMCPLADYLNAEIIQKYKMQYPSAPVVVYVNTTAETKAVADVCCTSSNALSIIQAVAKKWNTTTILFGPDKNLAAWVASQTKFNIISLPGNGNCPYHNDLTIQHVTHARKAHPDAMLLVHPESPMNVLELADYVGSTAGIEKEIVKVSNPTGYIIGTEIGMVDYLKEKYPSKQFFPLSVQAECKDMKKITLEKMVQLCRKIGTDSAVDYEIRVPGAVAENARKSIDAMFTL